MLRRSLHAWVHSRGFIPQCTAQVYMTSPSYRETWYFARSWPDDMIDHMLPFLDGCTLATFACSREYTKLAAKHARLGLEHITTLRLGSPVVAKWGSSARLFAVMTCPPDLMRLMDPDSAAWKPISEHVQASLRFTPSKNPGFDAVTNYDLPQHRKYMLKIALRLGDAAVIESVVRTFLREKEKRVVVSSGEFVNRIRARRGWLNSYMNDDENDDENEDVGEDGNDLPTWGGWSDIWSHFIRVEREQAAAAHEELPEQRVPLPLLECGSHDRCFPELASQSNLDTAAGWASHDSKVPFLRLVYNMGARLDQCGETGGNTGAILEATSLEVFAFLRAVTPPGVILWNANDVQITGPPE